LSQSNTVILSPAIFHLVSFETLRLMINFLGITITMLVVPFLVNNIAPDSTPGQWTWVFLITAGVLVITNLLFGLTCSAEAAYWTSDGFSTAASSTGIPDRSTVSSVNSVNGKHLPQTTMA
jgi:hypothetical protein